MTVRVRVLVSVAGPDYSYAPGDETTLPESEAAAWIGGRLAEAVNPTAPESEVEKTDPEPEKTTKARPSTTTKESPATPERSTTPRKTTTRRTATKRSTKRE